MKIIELHLLNYMYHLVRGSFSTKQEVLSQAFASFVIIGIFLIYILVNVISCGCDDCEYGEKKYPAYANKSGEMVKIVAIKESYAEHDYEKTIADGDSLHYTWEECTKEEPLWLVPCPVVFYDPAKMKIYLHFLSEPEKCLIFEGPIKQDGIDMRSWSSYKKGKVIEEQENWVDIEYVYTITPEHKAMAKESYCP